MITSTDGVRLAVQEHGDRANPTLVAVHGYPDNHTVWDGLVPLLSDRLHVVTYDVRGAGGSDRPAARSAYRIEQLVQDLGGVWMRGVLDHPRGVLKQLLSSYYIVLYQLPLLPELLARAGRPRTSTSPSASRSAHQPGGSTDCRPTPSPATTGWCGTHPS
jgi:hypothetical protein